MFENEKLAKSLLKLMGTAIETNSFSYDWLQKKSGLVKEQIIEAVKYLEKDGACQIVKISSEGYEFSDVVLLARGKFLINHLNEEANILRVSSNELEVARYLKDVYSTQSSVTIMQRIDQEVVITHGIFSKYLPQKKSITIELDDLNKKLNANAPLTIYIRKEAQSLLFKTTLTFYSQGEIRISFPEQIRIMEKRSILRHQFSSHDTKKVKLSKITELSYNKNLIHKISDISNTGFALIALPSEVEPFHPDDRFLIHKLSSEKLSPPLEAKVIYVAKTQFKKKKRFFNAFKVGLKFAESIPNEMINKLNIEEKKVS